MLDLQHYPHIKCDSLQIFSANHAEGMGIYPHFCCTVECENKLLSLGFLRPLVDISSLKKGTVRWVFSDNLNYDNLNHCSLMNHKRMYNVFQICKLSPISDIRRKWQKNIIPGAQGEEASAGSGKGGWQAALPPKN